MYGNLLKTTNSVQSIELHVSSVVLYSSTTFLKFIYKYIWLTIWVDEIHFNSKGDHVACEIKGIFYDPLADLVPRLEYFGGNNSM